MDGESSAQGRVYSAPVAGYSDRTQSSGFDSDGLRATCT